MPAHIPQRQALPEIRLRFPSGFCLQHLTESAAIGAGLQQPPDDSLDLSAELVPQLSEFHSAVAINQFLARLLVLVTKRRVSSRRASVLAYITNQLLHSHRAIARDNHSQPQQEGLILDFSDWPEPQDGSGIKGPACYRRAVLAGVNTIMTIYSEGRKGGAFLSVLMVNPFLAVLFHEAPASPDPTRRAS